MFRPLLQRAVRPSFNFSRTSPPLQVSRLTTKGLHKFKNPEAPSLPTSPYAETPILNKLDSIKEHVDTQFAALGMKFDVKNSWENMYQAHETQNARWKQVQANFDAVSTVHEAYVEKLAGLCTKVKSLEKDYNMLHNCAVHKDALKNPEDLVNNTACSVERRLLCNIKDGEDVIKITKKQLEHLVNNSVWDIKSRLLRRIDDGDYIVESLKKAVTKRDAMARRVQDADARLDQIASTVSDISSEVNTDIASFVSILFLFFILR